MTSTTKNQATLDARAGRLDLIITREFDAPRELVFRAFTEADLFVQWMGPRRLEIELVTFEPRSGGSWRYINTDTDGSRFAFHGVFHEVLAPERIIQTFEFEGLPEAGHVTLETAYFEELPGGRTGYRGISVFQTMEDREGMLQSGMEGGMNETYERLDELLARILQK